MKQIIFVWIILVFFTCPGRADPSHKLFDMVLKDHVVHGQVDYNAIKTDSRFHDYLVWLENVDATALSSKEEKLAFWINAYNALAIKGIIEGRSPASLLGRVKYFLGTRNKLAGMEITLDKLEKEIIIPMGDPRIHFAIVCASYSCPRLRAEAYVSSKLDQQLDDNARDFINDPKKNEFAAAKSIAKISKIFDWFENDFTDGSGSIGAYIAQFLDDPARARDLRENRYKIKFRKYNWSLNGSFSK